MAIKPYLEMARRVESAPDPYRVVLEQPIVAEPGTKWRYNNGAVELIGGILQKAIGHRLDEFAKEMLFEPLGITDFSLVVVVTAGVRDYDGKGPQSLACDTVMETGVMPAALNR